MTSIDIFAIEQKAREMRAEEMRKLSGVISNRMALYFRLLGNSLGSLLMLINDTLRTLFSWNPQQHRHN